MTQNNAILSYLKQRHTLTPLQAFYKFGTLRLSGRIFDLRAQGHKIIADMVRVGEKRVARYRLAV